MDKDKQKSSTAPVPNIDVNTNTIIGSQYAQIIGVTVSDVDATLEFVYINPQIKTKGQTVARITIPRSSAEELAKIISETIKKHEEAKKRT